MMTKVVHVDKPFEGAKEQWKVPKADNNYHRNLMKKPLRTSLKALNIDQPEGPSFTVCTQYIMSPGPELAALLSRP